MTLHLHHLTGCSPAPLADYLKALGILRLVAEQADANARGWWQDEHFCLLTTLAKKELESFFLEKYEPTPLLSPWNKGCGFFKAGDPGLAPLEASTAPRFARFREGIVDARKLLDQVANADAVIRAIKARTKTNKSFQTEPQRTVLAESVTFRGFVDQLKSTASKEGASAEDLATIRAEMEEVEVLVSAANKPPIKSEADQIKASDGYKRLLAAAERRFKSLKGTLIPDCRRAWRGAHAEWLSAAVVLDDDGNPRWPSLLGTGGNDGNLDFTNNAIQRLGELFDAKSADGEARPETAALLSNALWSDAANNLMATTIGQFQPGAAGGANSRTGPAGDSLVNAWDFLLMMEGSMPNPLAAAIQQQSVEPALRLPREPMLRGTLRRAMKRHNAANNGCRSGRDRPRFVMSQDCLVKQGSNWGDRRLIVRSMSCEPSVVLVLREASTHSRDTATWNATANRPWRSHWAASMCDSILKPL